MDHRVSIFGAEKLSGAGEREAGILDEQQRLEDVGVFAHRSGDDDGGSRRGERFVECGGVLGEDDGFGGGAFGAGYAGDFMLGGVALEFGVKQLGKLNQSHKNRAQGTGIRAQLVGFRVSKSRHRSANIHSSGRREGRLRGGSSSGGGPRAIGRGSGESSFR